jgi:acyl-CoA synthetase (AMP-forming)/AMP-acid ligase II/thioesterase domain-containing protein/acyl carrier protein
VIHRANHLSIPQVLLGWAEESPEAVALAAPDRIPLTYAALWAQIAGTVRVLNELGLGRGDRIAIVLPQGPELAAAFLAVASGAVAAPLSSTLRERDLEGLFSTLNPNAAILQDTVDSPTRVVARTMGIPIIELSAVPGAAAGEFLLRGERLPQHSSGGFSEPDDVGLMFSTSGTTSRPKIVPLTHRNFCSAAANTKAALELTDRDCCLNVMPLFHGHGLIAGVLASLVAGARVVCTPPFDISKFFGWMDEFRPTWYTAVPTIHQAVLAEASRHREIIARTPLRFIRSASAPLTLSVMAELERVFNVLVTENYGLTEAPQITNTPLDPRARKVGSLGIPGSSEVAIMDENGKLLGPGESGEIVCRGPVITTGYFNDGPATARCFTNGWFRTGDLGLIDGDGHLYMTGRLGEIINRGGDKVSPQEVDQILMGHPAIAQATTFGIPDSALGEEVAAAVVLRPGISASAAEIRQFVATRLAEFKAPRRVVIVPAIPTGPTGKLLRRELAESFGVVASPQPETEIVRPEERNPLEYHLTRIWEELLDIRPLGITDDFFDHGGNSLLAARMMVEIERACGRSMQPSILFQAPTVQQLARLLAEQPDPEPAQRPLIEVQAGGGQRPFVFLNGDFNGGGFYCRNLARRLDVRQPFYAFSPHGVDGDGAPATIEAMAEAYLDTLRSRQPEGPYLLGGFSHAGLVAFEMARRLEAVGEKVALLVVLDMPAPDPRLRFLQAAIAAVGRLRGTGSVEQREAFLTWRYRLFRLRELWRHGLGLLTSFARTGLRGRAQRHQASSLSVGPTDTDAVDDDRLQRIERAYTRVVHQYIPGVYGGRLTLVSSLEGQISPVHGDLALARGPYSEGVFGGRGWGGHRLDQAGRQTDPTLGWGKVAAEVKVVSVPGNHITCITKHVDILAERLQACLDEAQR